MRHAPKGTPWILKILGPALFFKADRYLNTLEKIWIDGVIKERHWKQFLEGLEKEWDKNLIMVCLCFSCSLDFHAMGGDHMYHTDINSLL